MNKRHEPGENASPDNIYQAPAANTTVGHSDSLIAAYIGPKNADYYLARFEQFENGESAVSWNWPAFFFSSVWLLYRKMWLYALLYWIVLPVALLFLAVVVSAFAGATAGDVFYYGAYFLLTFLLVPMFANWLYFRHALAKINKVSRSTSHGVDPAQEIARTGGTSNVILVVVPFFVVAVLGVLAAIAIPAYQDYVVRAQVAEGLQLAATARAAVSDEFADAGMIPPDNVSAGLPDVSAINGNYVSGVEVVDGEIVITYGNSADVAIHGKTIVMTPRVAKGDLEPNSTLAWSCSSADIVPKHLPAACRTE